MTGTLFIALQGILGLGLMGYLLYLPKEKALRHRVVSFFLAVLGNLSLTAAVVPSFRIPVICSIFLTSILLLVMVLLQYNHWCIPRVCEQISKLLRKVLHGTTH